MAAVSGLKYTATSQNESCFPADKVDVVDRTVYTERSFCPSGAAVFGIAVKTAVSAYPTPFRISELNGVQILPAGADPLGNPAALRVTDHRRQPAHDREHQRYSQ